MSVMADASGNGFDGTYTTSPDVQACVGMLAGAFSAQKTVAGGHMGDADLTGAATLGGDFTLFGVIDFRPGDSATTYAFISLSSPTHERIRFQWERDVGGNVNPAMVRTANASGETFLAGTWVSAFIYDDRNFIAVTYNAGTHTARFFLNGQHIGTHTIGGASPAFVDDIDTLGAVGAGPADVRVGGVAIFDSLLADADIAHITVNNLATMQSRVLAFSPVAWYRMDDADVIAPTADPQPSPLVPGQPIITEGGKAITASPGIALLTESDPVDLAELHYYLGSNASAQTIFVPHTHDNYSDAAKGQGNAGSGGADDGPAIGSLYVSSTQTEPLAFGQSVGYFSAGANIDWEVFETFIEFDTRYLTVAPASATLRLFLNLNQFGIVPQDVLVAIYDWGGGQITEGHWQPPTQLSSFTPIGSISVDGDALVGSDDAYTITLDPTAIPVGGYYTRLIVYSGKLRDAVDPLTGTSSVSDDAFIYGTDTPGTLFPRLILT